MSRIWTIMRREYLENVRTKAFLIGLILTPVWMGMIFLIPMLMRKTAPEKQDVYIVDETGVLAEGLKAALETDKGFEVQVVNAETAWTPDADGEMPLDRLKRRAGQGELFLVVLTPPLLEKRLADLEEHPYEIVGATSVGAELTGRLLQKRVNDLVNARIIAERNISPQDAALLQKDVQLWRSLDAEGQESQAGGFEAATPFIFMMLLFMGIVGISQMLISSTLEEKSNRVFEVLLSSVSPTQLMTGKILGICGVGFTLLLLWSGGGLIAASAQGLEGLVSGQQIGWFIVYYLLGFIMIASLMVAVGSACNTLKEAQNLMAPISLFLALPLLIAMVVMRDPNGNLAVAASFIPPFTPFLMMARIASVPPPPDWQIWATLLVLVLGSYFAFRLAGRVFRVGILLYGQPPNLKQIVRWMLAKD